jgi:hypothetical protein
MRSRHKIRACIVQQVLSQNTQIQELVHRWLHQGLELRGWSHAKGATSVSPALDFFLGKVGVITPD